MDLKNAFGIDNKAKETYLWSFLVVIACCIKFLEIEIYGMAQFEIQQSTNHKRKNAKQTAQIWKGFVMAPTHGAVGLNRDDEDDTEYAKYIQINIKDYDFKHMENWAYCVGCSLQMTKTNRRKDNKPYCLHCTKFRIYKEYVRKFVLEHDNEELREDLWSWHDNSVNQMSFDDYKDILDLYSDQVLHIGSIFNSNLKYYTPRSQTVPNADTAGSSSVPGSNIMYRNVRYLRKRAGVFIFGEREIWANLLELKRTLNRLRYDIDFKVSNDDRVHIKQLLQTKQISNLLYGKSGKETVSEIQRRILRRYEEHKNDDFVVPVNECKPGVDEFLQIWSRLPFWWEPVHDAVLLELALMHNLDVSQYQNALDEDQYFHFALDDSHYKAFEFWCTRTVNVQHRLRFLLYTIHHKDYPESMVFMNKIMKNSHLKAVTGGDNMDELNSKYDQREFRDVTRVRPARDVTREFRDIVQLLNPERFGAPIWRFVMHQMSAKARPSLGVLLTILAEELPSNTVFSLLEEDRELIRRCKPSDVTTICQAVIKSSKFPVTSALYLARYMEKNALSDLARSSMWRTFCDEYEDIAIDLINMVQSDHLLAMLFEIPTNIDYKSVIELAVSYRRVRLINSARVQAVMPHMWSESEFLNPNKPIRTTYLDLYEMYNFLWKSPVRFYFCPLGLYTTSALLYVAYLILVSFISCRDIYPYTEYDVVSLETVMWICNWGYILFEVLELESRRAQYFAMDSMNNRLDMCMSINWILLFILRICAIQFVPEINDYDGNKIPYVGDAQLEHMPNATNSEMAVLERHQGALKRNEPYTIVYMSLWSIQIIILWVRVVGLLQRTKTIGPLLRMISIVVKDVISFLILLIALTFGFLFAVRYVIGGDIDPDVTCDMSEEIDDCAEASQPLDNIISIAFYLLQTLLGQQDWSVMETNRLYGFGSGRAQLLTLVVIIYILLGSIIALSMLVAIMTTSFGRLNDEAKAQLAFLRVQTTYDTAHRGRMMPPPFNVFVIAVWIVITTLNMLIKVCTCGSCKLDIDAINPYYIACLRRRSQRGDNQYGIRKETESYSATKMKKKLIASQLHRHYLTENLDDRVDMLSLFESIDAMADDTKKRYCKHCYCRIRDIKDGKLENYFKCFAFGHGNSKVFDERDECMIKQRLQYCSLCPQCYRPYGIRSTDRYHRHHVLVEIISCYLFLLLIWIPLLLILFIPTLFSRLCNRISQSEVYNIQLDAGKHHSNDEYQKVVHRIVEKQYEGTNLFDSDDDDNDNDRKRKHVQTVLFEIDETVNMIQDPTYKPKGLHRSKKQTTIQLENIQKRKANKRAQPKVRLSIDDDKEEELLVMFDLTAIKKKISSAKDNDVEDNVDVEKP
eukprot:77583_1